MLAILSPAKSLDFEKIQQKAHTQPSFIEETQQLVDLMKGFSAQDLSKLMKISDKLAQLNFERYQKFPATLSPNSAKQAVFAFNGDSYRDLVAETLTTAQLDYAQDHLRLLSGLYGVLRPLDLIAPYRLEMGTKLKNPKGNTLTEFWGEKITQHLNAQLESNDDSALVNLASNEYFAAVQPEKLARPVIKPVFKDFKGGRYKVLAFYAKRARGAFARAIIVNQWKTVPELKSWQWQGYAFDAQSSSKNELVFTRRQEA